MDHSMHGMMDMDHGHDHGDMDMGDGQCSMNMLFTWSTKNLCIVFPQWRITSTWSLLGSLIVIVLLTAGYEGIRQLTRRFEAAHARRLSAYSTVAVGGSEVHDDSATANVPSSQTLPAPNTGSPLVVGRDSRRTVEQRGKITMAALYAVQVFYSFFIMLLFMTYNGFVMLAVAVGAFVGYLAFGDNTSASKTVACH
ncbi:low-affinity Cu transporter [Aspergillus vadensis CBS 113365]|uniref:Copper transport protein n=1 Tax=Aspergillus vadensis (strain CBS 113365 / IMI 142717 / IBT 24658) TaxID=1448311 RepID=A0A319BAX3_ASPVC|nr:Ctr copper transporter [Aspergillus vadensis CBS 113365]PYH69014.1 Ctr copper transporter [Aspergillus vadensis CBS 113365]